MGLMHIDNKRMKDNGRRRRVGYLGINATVCVAWSSGNFAVSDCERNLATRQTTERRLEGRPRNHSGHCGVDIKTLPEGWRRRAEQSLKWLLDLQRDRYSRRLLFNFNGNGKFLSDRSSQYIHTLRPTRSPSLSPPTEWWVTNH